MLEMYVIHDVCFLPWILTGFCTVLLWSSWHFSKGDLQIHTFGLCINITDYQVANSIGSLYVSSIEGIVAFSQHWFDDTNRIYFQM